MKVLEDHYHLLSVNDVFRKEYDFEHYVWLDTDS